MRTLLGTLVLSAALTTAYADPPETERRPVTDIVHGVELTDPYRWLEGDNSDPARLGRLTPEVAGWTDAQNRYTRDLLDNLPGRDALEDRLRDLMEIGSVGSPQMARGRYFNFQREGTQAQPVVYVRDAHDAEPRVLIDPNELDESGLLTVPWFVPSQCGTLLAFGMYESGDENTTLYVLEVDSGEWLADEIPGKVGGVNWLPDSSGFFYRRLADLDDPYSGQVRFHRLGTHHRQDPILFEQYTEGPHAKTWGPFAWTSRDARWMLLGYWTSTSSNDLWVVDLDRWFRTGEFEKREIVTGESSRFTGSVVGDTLYMQTDLDASNGRVIAVDLNRPGRDHWRDVIPERADAVLRGFGVARGQLVATYLHRASTRIERFALDGRSLGGVELPGIGSASISTADDRTEAFLSYSSYNEPQSIYRIDLAGDERELWARPDVPVDPDLVEVRQVSYTSKDGTEVTMFLIHRTGLELDGRNPTILYGYGGFNIPMTPGFIATMFPFFEAGGAYAVANLRGGGEYGSAWHEAGRMGNRQNVFDDFIAAAEWLIENGYTTTRRLGIAGGSNGGLLVGAAVTQRPDLFSAAICGVPLLDMVRFQKFLMARYWVPEYGSSEDPDQFEFILKYSPYHNIKPGTKYPAMLITTGENDMRVHPMHARKMAARLQAATGADHSEKPILLWVDRDAGHGAGKPLHLRIRDVADQRIFMMWQLGMLEGR